MRFGNTLESLRGGLTTTTIVGLCAGLVGVALSVSGHASVQGWPALVLLFLTAPVAFLLACLPTLAFSIRIEEGRVRHVVFDRFILSDLPAADFESLKRSTGPWAAKITFKGGRSIRFLGAHLGTIAALKAALEAESENG